MMPSTRPPSPVRRSTAAVIGKISTPSAAACSPSHFTRSPRLTITAPGVFICGGIIRPGSGMSPVAVSQWKVSRVTAGPTGAPMSRQPGSSSSSPTGFITAPEMICPPSSAAFSTTVTESSGANCFSRMAALRPAGPAPTITTSVSRISRVPASAKSGPIMVAGQGGL